MEDGTLESVPRIKQNDDLGGSVLEDAGGGSDNLASLGERVSRYASAKSKAREIYAYGAENVQSLRMSGGYSMFRGHCLGPAMPRAVKKLCGCGDYLHFRHYTEQDSVRLHEAFFCKQPLLCPLCAIRRGGRNVAAYSKVLQALDAVEEWQGVDQLVTLTVKNGEDLDERYRHLTKAISRLNMRRKDQRRGKGVTEWGIITAAVGAYEVTNIGNGWHPHAHIWVRAPRLLDEAALRAEWLDVTGDSKQIRVQPIVGEKVAAFCEVFKYACKFGDMTEQQIWHVWSVLRGRRMIFSYGAFRGVTVPDSLLDDELTGPYVDYFYTWAASVGYSLLRKR